MWYIKIQVTSSSEICGRVDIQVISKRLFMGFI